jgi:hypothetical protein
MDARDASTTWVALALSMTIASMVGMLQLRIILKK